MYSKGIFNAITSGAIFITIVGLVIWLGLFLSSQLMEDHERLVGIRSKKESILGEKVYLGSDTLIILEFRNGKYKLSDKEWYDEKLIKKILIE